MSESIRVLHLSDTHLYGDEESRHYQVVDTGAALDRVLAHAAHIDDIDLVVLSGDLSEDGSPASYERLKARVEPWAAARGAEIVYAMGNHDLPGGFELVLGARETVRELHGLRVIALDSSVPQAGYGAFEPSQLERLRELLAVPAPRGTVVVFHHPPLAAFSALLEALELQDRPAVLEALSSGDVRLVLSGHYHHALASSAAGIPVIVAPGVTNTTDATAPAGTERATVGSGYAVIDVPLEVGEAPRAVFVHVPSADDGHTLFDLSADEVEAIARAAGPQAE